VIAVTNALVEYYDEILKAGALCQNDSPEVVADGAFAPSFELPLMDGRLERFFSGSTVKVLELGSYKTSRIRLLDMTLNPRTRTTKTFASHVMVARAIRHIQTTGESVLLVTPSSANKGVALRDAVLKAIECELVQPHQLRIAIVVPRRGLPKLWSSQLATSPKLRQLNPVFLVQTDDGSAVKRLTKSFVEQHSVQLRNEQGVRVWHTYQLDNYRMGDAVRAFIEASRLEHPIPSGVRIHAQAVSSAFGLLGYDHGRRVLTEVLGRDSGTPAQWLLVQHLGTPDLVLHGLYGSCSRQNMPNYTADRSSGLLVQSSSLAFPFKTAAPDDEIDSTFYSKNPATAEMVSAIQRRQGGVGIVVSLQECLERYVFLRTLLPSGAPRLPLDHRDLREWALVMVLTGVLGAIDRGLVRGGSEILVHATGSYSVHDYEPLAEQHTISTSDAMDMLHAVQ